MAEAAAVGFVELFPDSVADRGTGNDADDRPDRSVLFRDAIRDDAADNAADDCGDLLAVAATRRDLVVALPRDTRVADVVGVVLLSPAVRGRVRRRVGECGARPSGDRGRHQ